jgi:hypothetical protein
MESSDPAAYLGVDELLRARERREIYTDLEKSGDCELRICSGETGRLADPNLNKFGSQFLIGKLTIFIDFRENQRTGGLRCLTKMSNLLERHGILPTGQRSTFSCM